MHRTALQQPEIQYVIKRWINTIERTKTSAELRSVWVAGGPWWALDIRLFQGQRDVVEQGGGVHPVRPRAHSRWSQLAQTNIVRNVRKKCSSLFREERML